MWGFLSGVLERALETGLTLFIVILILIIAACFSFTIFFRLLAIIFMAGVAAFVFYEIMGELDLLEAAKVAFGPFPYSEIASAGAKPWISSALALVLFPVFLYFIRDLRRIDTRIPARRRRLQAEWDAHKAAYAKEKENRAAQKALGETPTESPHLAFLQATSFSALQANALFPPRGIIEKKLSSSVWLRWLYRLAIIPLSFSHYVFFQFGTPFGPFSNVWYIFIINISLFLIGSMFLWIIGAPDGRSSSDEPAEGVVDCVGGYPAIIASCGVILFKADDYEYFLISITNALPSWMAQILTGG